MSSQMKEINIEKIMEEIREDIAQRGYKDYRQCEGCAWRKDGFQ